MANDKPSDWSITDVGGQIHERTTWYEEYTDCSGVIFVMGLSDFDQQSQDKRKTNKFVEDGINLMLEVAKVETLQGVPLIIMLNKKDLFEEKVKVSETGICATFPEYAGDKNDPKERYVGERASRSNFRRGLRGPSNTRRGPRGPSNTRRGNHLMK